MDIKSEFSKLFHFTSGQNLSADLEQIKAKVIQVEQLKSIVTLLLHFKHILQVIRHHCLPEDSKAMCELRKRAPDLHLDLDYCLERYTEMMTACNLLEEKESIYIACDLSGTTYVPLKRDSQAFDVIDMKTLLDELDIALGDFQSNQLLATLDLPADSLAFHKNAPAIAAAVVGASKPKQNQANFSGLNNTDDHVYTSNNQNISNFKLIPMIHVNLSKGVSKPKATFSHNNEINVVGIDGGGPSTEMVQLEYWCSFEGCRFKSKTLAEVNIHEDKRHGDKSLHKCWHDSCDGVFEERKGLDEHIEMVHGTSQVFRCEMPECGLVFTNDTKRKQHFREDHHDLYLTCKSCDKKFKTRKNLTNHCYRVHRKMKIDDLTTVMDKTPLTLNLRCHVEGCSKKFSKKSTLKLHLKEKHGDAYLTCKHCDRVFKSRNNLTNHIWMMHEEGEYKCPQAGCDFMSKIRKLMLNHKKLRHQRIRVCAIEGCGQAVPITRFHRHLSSMHKIKNYACSWPDCGKSFADNSALKNHVRIHLNFKRFKCKWPNCGYASEQRHTVITHIRVCHFKLPRTKKKQAELNIMQDPCTQNPYDYLEADREDICL